MKERPGLHETVSTLHRELTRQFESNLYPQAPVFDPINDKATLLDPRYRIVLSSAKVEA